MLGYSLWFIAFFQVTFIYAANDESEYVHIKVHIPDLPRKSQQAIHRLVRQHHHNHQRKKQQYPIEQKFHYPAKQPLRETLSTQHHDNSSPYEFDFFELREAGGGKNAKDIIPEQLMRNIPKGYGPVVFNNDIESSTVSSLEQPTLMNKQLMHQLFTPEIMSALDTSHELNDDITAPTTTYTSSRSSITPKTLHKHNDLLHEYFEQLNRRQQKKSTKITQKRKKYNQNDEETIELEPQQEVEQQQQRNFQPFYSTNQYFQPQLQHKRKQQTQQSQFQRHQNYNPLHWAFEHDDSEEDDDNNVDSNASDDVSNEFNMDEDVTPSASNSNEDITSAFNKLQPISYQDVYDTYVTPLTSTNYGASQQTTEPTFSGTNSNWRQYYHQPQYQHLRPQVHQQQPQLQQKQRYQQQHIQHQQKNPKQNRAKSKSQQTQYLLPSTTLRLTTTTSSSSPLSSSSSSSSLTSPSSSLSTSPINSGFTGGSITSTRTLPWTLPYEFVQQSQQEQLHHHHHQQQQQQHQQKQKQRQHEQQLETQQYLHKQPKLPYHKKRKNRNKRNRTRIIVE